MHHLFLTYPLSARVVGAPQMILQPVPSIFPCSPLPSGTWRNTGLSIPRCCLPQLFLCLPLSSSPFHCAFTSSGSQIIYYPKLQFRQSQRRNLHDLSALSSSPFHCAFTSSSSRIIYYPKLPLSAKSAQKPSRHVCLVFFPLSLCLHFKRQSNHLLP